MPKRDLRELNEELLSFEKSIHPTEVVKAPMLEYGKVKIALKINTNYKITGIVSGRDYLFLGAGSVLDVDERDVDWILSLRRQKSCCGGGGANTIFELVGE